MSTTVKFVIIVLIAFFASQLESLLIAKKSLRSTITTTHFKKKNGSNNNNESNPDEDKQPSLWQGIKKFLPNTSRAKLEETYSEPVPGTCIKNVVNLIPTNTFDPFNNRQWISIRSQTS